MPADCARPESRPDLLPSSYVYVVVGSTHSAPKSIMNDTHFTIHILGIILPVDITARRLVLEGKGGVPDLCRKAILEVEQACLTYILDLSARLAYNCRFEAHARAGVPAEDGKGSITSTTRASELLLGLPSFNAKISHGGYARKTFNMYHSNEGIVTEA